VQAGVMPLAHLASQRLQVGNVICQGKIHGNLMGIMWDNTYHRRWDKAQLCVWCLGCIAKFTTQLKRVDSCILIMGTLLNPNTDSIQLI
jgi:hypothetical protein